MDDKCPDWMRLWFEVFFIDAIAITDDTPLPLGWCVYVEALHLE
ncbi:hypothetical protein ACTXGO_00820 [Psychrobacter sp. T6-1]